VKRWHSIMLSVGLGTAMGVAGIAYVAPRYPKSPTLEGLKIAGIELAVGSDLHAVLEERDAEFRARTVILEGDGTQHEVTMGDIGGEIDIRATLVAAFAKGQNGSYVKRWRQAAAARRGEVDIPIVYKLDRQTAQTFVQRYAEELKKDAVDARMDLAKHAKIPDVLGRELDPVATAEELANTFTSVDNLLLVTKPIEAEVTLHDLDDIDISKVLATFETKFHPWKKGRSANVRHAATFLNGLVIRKGQTISFNERVGPRTTDRGFQKAPEIVGDELTIGIGGGTCQVSSTLHGAAVYGGLSVISRKSHSRPSSYTRLGLDATVAYPSVDLKLRNPYSFSVVIHAFEPEKGTLRVEVLGGQAVADVKYQYGISSIEQYVRRITVKDWLKPGRSFRKQKGTRGMDVHSHVVIHYLDGRVEKRQYYSGYRATPEVYWVAPDVEQSELPELPDHAKGVEGQLSADGSDVYPTNG
jgi:vancomycin resistance protein YoaR